MALLFLHDFCCTFKAPWVICTVAPLKFSFSQEWRRDLKKNKNECFIKHGMNLNTKSSKEENLYTEKNWYNQKFLLVLTSATTCINIIYVLSFSPHMAVFIWFPKGFKHCTVWPQFSAVSSHCKVWDGFADVDCLHLPEVEIHNAQCLP